MFRSISLAFVAVSMLALGLSGEARIGPAEATTNGIVEIPLGDDVMVAVVAGLSGPVPEIGAGQLNATRMAIDDYGLIQGFGVTVNDFDDACDATAAAAAATTVITEPAHLGVIGHTCSGAAAAGLPIYEGAAVVAITGSATSVGLPGEGPTVFNRTIVDDPGGPDGFIEAVRTQPQYQAWAGAYNQWVAANTSGGSAGPLGAVAEPPQFAEFFYDAAMLLLTRIDEVATVDGDGDLVINRSALAAAVRDTTDFRGITCDITITTSGDRATDLGDLTPCDPVGQLVVWGDANCSGGADPVDSLLTLRSDAGLSANTGDCPAFGTSQEVTAGSPSPANAGPAGLSTYLWGDVDCGGAINPVDSLKLLRVDAGLSASQALGCPPIGADVSITPGAGS